MNPSSVEIIGAVLFAIAVLHTFSTRLFERLAYLRPRHAGLWHLLGEVEVVFGLWAAVLVGFVFLLEGRTAAVSYLDSRNYTEPMFVFVIMVIAASRPVIDSTRAAVDILARSMPLPGMAGFYWIVLTLVPLLGSFITEPGAMTMGALILSRSVFAWGLSERLKYATVAVLFVNVSIGGTLTPFAAPPVLMVAAKWNWDLAFMLTQIGWKSALAVAINASAAALIFGRELAALRPPAPRAAPPAGPAAQATAARADDDGLLAGCGGRAGVSAAPAAGKAARTGDALLADAVQGSGERSGGLAARRPVPVALVAVHFAFLVGVIVFAHHPAAFLGLFLFFLGVANAYKEHQNRLILREGLMVAFFLAGLVVLGGKQQWWLQQALASMSAAGVYYGATALTAITDNAALTYLGSLVEGLTDEFKYALVTGAVTGGGMTVIANAPNPAGQAILKTHFKDNNVGALWLFIAAIPPTLVAVSVFRLL